MATTYLADGMDVSHAAPELQAKAAEVFPRARRTITNAIRRGRADRLRVRRPAIPHGRNAKELVALVDRGMTPVQAIGRHHRRRRADRRRRPGRLAEGLLADVIAVPGDPLADITMTESVCFVMKGGEVSATTRPTSRADGRRPVRSTAGQRGHELPGPLRRGQLLLAGLADGHDPEGDVGRPGVGKGLQPSADRASLPAARMSPTVRASPRSSSFW